MRINVGLKLGLWLALLGIFSTSLTGYYAYTKSRTLLINAAEDKLLTATQVLAHRFTSSIAGITSDASLFTTLPTVKRIANSPVDANEITAEKAQLAQVMSSMLISHPEYFQIRLIGKHNFGREIVRVDRDYDGIKIVTGDELQEKGYLAYFYKTLKLKPGEFYVSRINLNRELGAHLGLNKPTIRIATPIESNTGKVFGIIVINVDLNQMFSLIKSDIPKDIKVFLTNSEGDYLIHPDASKTFGFDLGRRFLIQNDLKETTGILNGTGNNIVLNTNDIEEPDSAYVASFVKVPFGTNDNRFVLLGLSTPLNAVLQ